MNQLQIEYRKYQQVVKEDPNAYTCFDDYLNDQVRTSEVFAVPRQIRLAEIHHNATGAWEGICVDTNDNMRRIWMGSNFDASDVVEEVEKWLNGIDLNWRKRIYDAENAKTNSGTQVTCSEFT